MVKKRTIGVNERGNRVGETHHRARLTDHDVDLMRELWEEGKITTGELAEKFEVSWSTVHDIVTYQKRAQTVARWREIRIKPKK